jgi:hypothetical protein
VLFPIEPRSYSAMRLLSLICNPIPTLSLAFDAWIRWYANGFELFNSVLLMIGHVFAYAGKFTCRLPFSAGNELIFSGVPKI